VNGHALAGGQTHLVSVPSDLVHLAAAAIWTGGVAGLAVVGRFALGRSPSPQRRGELAALTGRFARTAVVAVVALAVSGVLRALGELDAASQLWTTSYGRALLAKTGLFSLLVAAALLHRGRPSSRMLAAELGVFAVLVGAVSVLTSLRPGSDIAVATGSTGATLLDVGAQADDLAVGLALSGNEGSPLTARATVLAPSGPVSNLAVRVSISGREFAAKACGAGCYVASTGLRGRPTSLAIILRRPGRKPAVGHFRVPAVWPPPGAATIVRRAARTFRALRTLTIASRLASSPANETTTIWKLQAPDRLSYRVQGGSEAVIVGPRRWDREDGRGRWIESAQTPVRQPAPPWPAPFRSARLLGSAVVEGRSVWIVSFADPVTPSWFRIAVDKSTYRTLSADMVATAHFMQERYLDFDAPVVVEPPVAGSVSR
jgi:uncharacterized membrane protein